MARPSWCSSSLSQGDLLFFPTVQKQRGHWGSAQVDVGVVPAGKVPENPVGPLWGQGGGAERFPPFQEQCPPCVDDFLYICDDAYKREELVAMEKSILRTLNFDINIPIPYRFLRRFAKVGAPLPSCHPPRGAQAALGGGGGWQNPTVGF